MVLIIQALRTRALAILLALVATALTGCQGVSLISSYDEPTDKALTALQQSSDNFLTKMIEKAPSPDNSYDKHRGFYEDADQQLRRIEFRVAALPKNSQTQKLVTDIRAAILGEGKCTAEGASLRDLHCIPSNLSNGPSKRSLEIAKQSINQTIHAALALELAKKQGLESVSSK